METAGELKRMPIYADKRLENELEHLFKEKNNTLTREDEHWEKANVTPNDLYACSSMHYHVKGEKPTDAITRIITSRAESAPAPHTCSTVTETETETKTETTEQDRKKKMMRILDLGSGYGGMARVLPTMLRPTWNAHVVAVEVQPSLHEAAADITKRLGAARDVTHVNADACDADAMREILRQHGQFDLCVTVLVLLHLTEAQRTKAFANLRTMLGTTKMLYIEDYFFLDASKLTARQKHNLDALVACTYLPSREEYVAQLEAAGFKVEDFEDVTSEWAAFTKERLNIFDSKRERHNDVHGPELVERLAHFYTATSEILAGGGVGGARILCTAI